MDNLFNTGIRPAIDDYLKKKSEEERNYGEYWSASSAGYCMRLNIMRRLGVPKVPELEDNATQTRIFEAGHIFHEWLQRITKDAGLSIASEVELQDEKLMIRGHFDDLVLVGEEPRHPLSGDTRYFCERCDIYDERGEAAHYKTLIDGKPFHSENPPNRNHLILYDYKTAHSASFNFKKRQTEIGHYHKMQLGTYMYMLRKGLSERLFDYKAQMAGLNEARILSISKDDLRMHEVQLLWTPKLEKEIYEYWATLNGYWKAKTLPKCTCLDHDGGFMGRRSAKGKVYNDFFWQDEPCSEAWFKNWKQVQAEKEISHDDKFKA